jgi:hypothetical protein
LDVPEQLRGLGWRIGRGRIGAACALALVAGPQVGSAQTPSAPPPSPESPRQNKAGPQTGAAAPPSNTVSGVTVTISREIPKAVGTYPAQGASIAPGILIIRISYDTRMQGQSWSYVTSRDGEYPECAASPRLLDDHKSFALICRTLPNKTYALWFNHGDYQNFTSMSHRPAAAYELKFTTSDADPVWTLEDAIKADPGLPPGSNPAEAEGKRRPGEDAPDLEP